MLSVKRDNEDTQRERRHLIGNRQTDILPHYESSTHSSISRTRKASDKPRALPHRGLKAWPMPRNRSDPLYAACRISWGSQDAPVSVLDWRGNFLKVTVTEFSSLIVAVAGTTALEFCAALR